MDLRFTTTTFDLPGCRVVHNLGVVRGLTVRSRSVLGNIAGAVETFFGGFGQQITVYTSLCERARQEAFDLMVQHADAIGANAIIGIRYDANEVMQGVTEVLAYGTAVVVEANPQP